MPAEPIPPAPGEPPLADSRRPQLTVVIPTLDEADRLPACLASVGWAAEIIVVDAGSRDGTPDVARAAGATVLHCPGLRIGEQKNVGIARARHEWILSIDADERVTPALRVAIERAIACPTATAYRVHLFNRYLGAPFMRGSWGRDRHIRLFRSSCRWSTHQVHEKLEVRGDVHDLDGYLEHESYRDLVHQLQKGVTYAAWGAADLDHHPRRVSLVTLVGRPVWRFVKTWLLQGMWRDGVRGFVFCAIHAWACFAKYAVLWDRQRIARNVAASAPEVPRSTATASGHRRRPHPHLDNDEVLAGSA